MTRSPGALSPLVRPSEAPDSPLGPDGALRFGMHRTPYRTVDLDRAAVAGWPGPLAHLRLKQWQHFIVIAPDLALSFAIVNAAYTAVAWIQVIDRRTGQRQEVHANLLPPRARLARSLWDERCSARWRKGEIDVHNHLDGDGHHIRLRADTPTPLEAELSCLHKQVEPLVVMLPVGRGRGMYSHKVPLPVTGTVRLGDSTITLSADTTTALLDIHKAHYPRQMFWNWATLAGFDAAGRRVAINLTRNVVTDPSYHENALWVDGRVSLLGAAQFDLSGERWTMGTADGRVSLRFTSQGERREDLDLGPLAKSWFSQRYGLYDGTIRTDEGEIAVSGWFGLAEDHRSTW